MNIRETLVDRFATVPLTRYDEHFAFDWSAVTDDYIAQCAAHGLKQKCNDGLGAKGLTEPERRRIFANTLKAAQLSQWGSPRDGDPLSVQVTSMARIAANAHFKKLGIQATKIDPKAWAAKMAELRANPKIVEAAKTAVATLAELEI